MFEQPAVSVGNVGQLTSDLIISSTEMTKIGYIHDDSTLPMVGNDPFSRPDPKTCQLVTSCESKMPPGLLIHIFMYKLKTKKIVY